MTVRDNPYPVVNLAIETFGDWLKHRRELRELREVDAAYLGQIASDLRMSSADLEALVRQGPHSADELPKMLTALGIDQNDLARTEPLVLRDMAKMGIDRFGDPPALFRYGRRKPAPYRVVGLAG